MKKVLLLNLPFETPVQRDYGCPHGIKADYYWPPIDLLLFGAIVRDAVELEYLDCMAGKISWTECPGKITALRPDIVFTIISSLTLESDLSYLCELKCSLPSVRVWAGGDVVYFTDNHFAGVDVPVRDLTNGKAIADLLGEENISVSMEPSANGELRYGIPPHELLRGYGYAMPYSLHRDITCVLTNYGCPFPCTFCNSNRLPFKKRPVGEIIRELLYIQELGMQEVVFRDFTFTLSDIETLCEQIRENGITLAWSCWTRVDAIDRQLLQNMKAAGCYLISCGVESGEDAVLADTAKGVTTGKIKEIVELTRAEGIEVLVSIILGFPGEDPQRTISYVHDLDPAYLAVNLLAPRVGSTIFDESFLSADGKPVYDTMGLAALRDATEKGFYLRPRKLLRYFGLVFKSRQRFLIFLRSAAGLFMKWRTRRHSRR